MYHKIFDIVTGITFICSLLHSLLPPWDGFADFPRFQKYYKAFVYVIGYMGVNARSTVYKSIATSNGTKISDAGNGDAH